MKLTTTLAKNLKLLFRSKETAYTILAGPLLIILVVSFAFLGSGDEYALRLGATGENGISDATIHALNTHGYRVSVFADNTSCIEGVRQGRTHACLIFQPTQDAVFPVTFAVDPSRTTIVYKIIDDVAGELDLQADAIRRELAGDALQRLALGGERIVQEGAAARAYAKDLGVAAERLRNAQDAMRTIPNTTSNSSDLVLLRGYQQGLAQDAKQVRVLAEEALDEALVTITQLERECDNCSADERIENARTAIRDAQDAMRQITEDVVEDKLFQANIQLSYAIDAVDLAAVALNATQAASVVSRDHLTAADGIVTSSAASVDQLAQRLAATGDYLQGSPASVEQLTTPVASTIISVTVTEDRLSFAYPYLLVLVIMFVGILLASMLVVADKTSRAAFRNFTTPTSDGYHVFVSFLTAFLILFVEILIILLLSSAFIAEPLLLHPGTTLLLVAVAIMLFTFLGMVVGYLSTTHEAAMIASISVASVLLFVSNLVFPVEGMTRIVQALSTLNPYIVLSELLKRSMLYGVDISQAGREIGLLLAICLVLLALTVAVQRQIKRRYFRQELGILQAHVPTPLRIGEVYVHNELELLDALDRMTRGEFEAFLTHDADAIPRWVSMQLRERRLARHLTTRSKERMILKLERHVRKRGKR